MPTFSRQQKLANGTFQLMLDDDGHLCALLAVDTRIGRIETLLHLSPKAAQSVRETGNVSTGAISILTYASNQALVDAIEQTSPMMQQVDAMQVPAMSTALATITRARVGDIRSRHYLKALVSLAKSVEGETFPQVRSSILQGNHPPCVKALARKSADAIAREANVYVGATAILHRTSPRLFATHDALVQTIQTGNVPATKQALRLAYEQHYLRKAAAMAHGARGACCGDCAKTNTRCGGQKKAA